MASSKRTQSNADVIIVGADLHSLLLALRLRRQGAQVVIFEAREQAGLGNVAPSVNGKILPSGLRYVADTIENRALLAECSELVGINIPIKAFESRPVTLSGHEIREFIGFGDKAFASSDELTIHTSHQQLDVGSSLEEVTAELATSPELLLRLRHEVTRIEVTEGAVSSVTVNEDSIWTADRVVYGASPHSILQLLPDHALAPRDKTRIAKSSSWTTVQIVLAHPKVVTQQQGIHFLLTPGPDLEPTIGRWFVPGEDGTQFSAWMTLVSPERAEDLEYVGSAVRALKKQVKKAQSEAFEGLLAEHLLVLTDHYGTPDLRLKDFRFPEVKNLYFGSYLLSDQRGPLAHLDVAHRLGEVLAPQTQKSKPEAEPPVAQADGSC